MSTEKSRAMTLLEKIAGGPLTLGRLLRSIRLGEGMSLAACARLLRVNRTRLAAIERGRSTVSPSRAAEFARILGYSEKQFVELSLEALLKADGLAFSVHVEAA